MAVILLCFTVALTTLSPLVLTQKSPIYECPDGWSVYQEGMTCIKISDEGRKLSWEEARAECSEDGGDLAKIDDPGMRDFVKGLISGRKYYWIGLHDKNNDGKFQWLDEQQQISFEWWNCREPNNFGGKERCVEVIANRNGRWNDKRCSKKRQFICQKEATEKKDPTYECLDDWSVYQEGKTCIKISDEGEDLTWEEAKNDCSVNGGDLAKIDDPGMKDFVQGLINIKARYWIGLKDDDGDGKYQWLDGKQISFDWWMDGEPRNAHGKERCVEMLSYWKGRWIAQLCANKRPFICQMEAREKIELPENVNNSHSLPHLT